MGKTRCISNTPLLHASIVLVPVFFLRSFFFIQYGSNSKRALKFSGAIVL